MIHCPGTVSGSGGKELVLVLDVGGNALELHEVGHALGEPDRREGGAVHEGERTDFGHAFGKRDLLEDFTAVEGERPDGGHAFRNGDLPDGGAREQPRRDGGYALGELDFLDGGVRKCVLANFGHALRKGELIQGFAAPKGCPTDGGYALGNSDLLEGGALESTSPNCGQSRGENNLLEVSAVREGFFPDGVERAREPDRLDVIASFERALRDGGYALGNGKDAVDGVDGVGFVDGGSVNCVDNFHNKYLRTLSAAFDNLSEFSALRLKYKKPMVLPFCLETNGIKNPMLFLVDII